MIVGCVLDATLGQNTNVLEKLLKAALDAHIVHQTTICVYLYLDLSFFPLSSPKTL